MARRGNEEPGVIGYSPTHNEEVFFLIAAVENVGQDLSVLWTSHPEALFAFDSGLGSFNFCLRPDLNPLLSL